MSCNLFVTFIYENKYFSESIAKKRSEVHDEIAIIESRFVASRAQENNGTTDEQKDNETTPTKHNRRTSHEDDDNDSNYNSDDDLMNHPNDESNSAPDISIVKKEQGNSNQLTLCNSNAFF